MGFGVEQDIHVSMKKDNGNNNIDTIIEYALDLLSK